MKKIILVFVLLILITNTNAVNSEENCITGYACRINTEKTDNKTDEQNIKQETKIKKLEDKDNKSNKKQTKEKQKHIK